MTRADAIIALSAMITLGCNGSTAPKADDAVTGTGTGTSSAALVKPQVTWPSVSSVDARVRASLGNARDQQAKVNQSVVPVLVPSTVTLDDPTLVVEGEFYSLSIHDGGLTIHVQGTRAAHRYEGVGPIAGNRALRNTKGFVSVNEDIRTASWMENGAAYSVDVECSARDDARCTGDAFVVGIVEKLVYVGGAGR